MFIKKYIPSPVKVTLLRVYAQLKEATLYIFSLSQFSSSLYYCFFSRKFSREHQSVLKARVAYLKSHFNNNDSSVLLRRNIHRIEKGLIMQPAKAIFALSYITETINEYSKAVQNPHHDQQELLWAKEVLNLYYLSIDANLLPFKISTIFQQLNLEKEKVLQFKNVPYPFSDKVVSDVSYQQLITLCQQRRSVRWFKPKVVPRVLLEQTVEIATLAPSACNRQPFIFNIVDRQPLLAELACLPLGTEGFAHNIQCIVVVSGDLSYYPTERDRHLIYIDSALACMQFMLALETLELSSCVLNWPDIEAKEAKISQLLNLGDSIRPTMLIAVGYAQTDGKIPYSQKKSAKQLINYITP